MLLDDLFNEYKLPSSDSGHQKANCVAKARLLLANASDQDWDWLAMGLRDDVCKWFVATIFASTPVPRRLFKEMVRTAIDEINPSLNKAFISPIVESFGHRIVNEALLDFMENGNDFEKAGAINASYWGGMSISYPSKTTEFKLENATAESRDKYLDMKDLWDRRRDLFLREFVLNENVEVRRSIIPRLTFDENEYPVELKPFVSVAIAIARSHEDEYIRHRVEVQLGNERLLKPIPERSLSSWWIARSLLQGERQKP